MRLLMAVQAVLVCAGGAVAQPAAYNLHRAGLYGAEYTSSAGTRNVTGVRLSASGLVVGRSERFQGTTSRGFAAWFYEGGGTARIGYFDAAHTSSAGDQSSFITAINSSGTVVGTSSRYVGALQGTTAWIYRNDSIARIGLTSGVFTAPSGVQSSSVRALNNAGQVGGYSVQYLAGGEALVLPWLYDGGVYTVLGLTDSTHTRDDGVRSGVVTSLNEAGDAAGTSAQFSGSVSLGTSAWVRRAGVTARAGLTGGLFTAADGSQYSSIFGLSADGRGAGTSDFYIPAGPIGTATWIADGQGTARIGLFDANHTSSSGQQLCYPEAMSPSGNVIGRAFRYAGGQGSNGESAWVYSNGSSVRIGLIGPGYSGTGGFEYSQAQQVNDRGEVLGNSTVFTPQWSGGPAAWVYRAGQTVRVGLVDAAHTNPDSGFQSSRGVQLNARGDAIGTSARYTPPFVNDDGWYYDRASDTVIPLVFSTSPTGEARSVASMLTDDGVVYGSYRKYNGATVVGDFLFRWSMAHGMEELAPLVQGGVGGAGWQNLAAVFGAGVPGTWDHTTVVGTGRITGETQASVFVLSVPPLCGTADFDCDGEWTDADIEAFFACLAGRCPVLPCTNGADFNGDGDAGTDADIESFFRVLAGGGC